MIKIVLHSVHVRADISGYVCRLVKLSMMSECAGLTGTAMLVGVCTKVNMMPSLTGWVHCTESMLH